MGHFRPLEGIQVLIVDDNEDARPLMKQALIVDGATVVATDSTFEALDVLRYMIPDAVVTDIAMPGESGHQLLKEIRKLPPEHGGTVPVLAVTAFGSAFSRERALAEGFNEYLTKPLDPWELCRLVAKLIGRAA
jgi:CheY-like chemotaxis protein